MWHPHAQKPSVSPNTWKMRPKTMQKISVQTPRDFRFEPEFSRAGHGHWPAHSAPAAEWQFDWWSRDHHPLRLWGWDKLNHPRGIKYNKSHGKNIKRGENKKVKKVKPYCSLTTQCIINGCASVINFHPNLTQHTWSVLLVMNSSIQLFFKLKVVLNFL